MDAVVIDYRQQRGLALAQAKAKRIKQIVSGTFLVPSQTGTSGGYVVDTQAKTCTCPDFETRAKKCKHMWALSYARHEVIAPDGSTAVVETMRITYGQDWPRYNKAQTCEKEYSRVLLRALCDGIQQEPQKGRGRRRHEIGDMVHAATMKVWTGLSGRRATTDIRECGQQGLLGRTPGYNTIFEYLGRRELTPLLMTLIEETAAPLADVDAERVFAVDGTGFGCTSYDRWYDEKYGKERKSCTWMKLHAACGVRTNIITAAFVTEGSRSDHDQLTGLIETTAKQFQMDKLLADKGYHSHENRDAIARLGAVGYIPFKVNSQSEGSEVWRQAWHYFCFHRPAFLAHYHQRSNVETTFHMIKSKFGGAVRSKNYDAQVNEILCKVLCHNLSVLVSSIFEMGLDPASFWPASAKYPLAVG